MTSAGTALPAALQTLASALGGADGRTLARAARQLADGAPLSEVLVDGAGFEAVEGALLITAERTGRLPELLGQLADRAEALAEVRSRVLASLAWPMITVLVGAVMMPVPALIQRGVGAYLAECAMWLGALAAGAAVIGVGIPAALRVPAIADIVIAVLDPIPGIGTFIRTRRLSLLFGALGPALECGLPITEALELAANATGERSVRNRMAKIGPRLVAGEDLAQLLAEISGVNRETRARIASGVQSGRLADACMRLANEQAIAYRRAVEWMGTAIRLGLTLLITVLVGASIVRHMQQLLTAPLGGMGGDASELQRELMRALPSLGR
ncbi:MAG: type II secretion system F family protein [Myxococcales bacterium]|nr:type II secretion system F family protein [Myxococcales bacterium]